VCQTVFDGADSTHTPVSDTCSGLDTSGKVSPLDRQSAFTGVLSTYFHLVSASLSPYSPIADTLEASALGRNALIVYDALTASGTSLTISSITARSGLTVNKVRTAIQKLTRFGMVEHRGKRLGYAAVPKSLREIADVAKEAGTDGNTARRKAKHIEERAIHEAHMILRARQERDEANLPLDMQLARDWKCSSCGDQLHSRYGTLPEVCPHCGDVAPAWIRLPRPKKRPSSKT